MATGQPYLQQLGLASTPGSIRDRDSRRGGTGQYFVLGAGFRSAATRIGGLGAGGDALGLAVAAGFGGRGRALAITKNGTLGRGGGLVVEGQ